MLYSWSEGLCSKICLHHPEDVRRIDPGHGGSPDRFSNQVFAWPTAENADGRRRGLRQGPLREGNEAAKDPNAFFKEKVQEDRFGSISV